jgi:PilZ domain
VPTPTDPQTVPRAAPPDRRAWVRYRPERPPAGRVFIAATYCRLSADVLDLSCGGVALLLGRPVEPGTLLTIEFGGGVGAVPFEAVASVANVTELPGGRWRCGAELLAPLTEAEVKLLVR